MEPHNWTHPLFFFTRSPDGKLLTRTWARQVGPNEDKDLVTEYVFDDDTGELRQVLYYDEDETPDPNTHDISYTYTRLGQQETVVDIVGARTFAYNAYGELLSETIEAGANGLYSRTITRDYENGSGETVAGRYAGFHIGTEYVVTYAYEPKTTSTGRLNRINGPGLPASSGGAFYGYTANSDLVGSLKYKDTSGTAVASVTREYDDHRDLLESIENEESGTPETISMYTYAYDGAGRRTSVVYTGSAFSQNHLFLWGYNPRGELTTADRHEGTTPGSPGTQYATNGAFDFAYDPIGNRLTSNVDDSQTPTHYCTNEVNQYDATAAAAGCDPPTESFGYDADGNLTADGTMRYVWNGENRLIEAFPTSPAANDVKVRFAYDYMGRRVEKVVSTHDGSAWSEQSRQRFVYDGPALDRPGTGTSQGWNVVLVLDANNDTQRKYTWGLDLSGTVHAAGGIGGLLAVEETATQGSPAYWYSYDGNGNVGQVIAADGQSAVAKYEYGPYGNLIASSGTYVDANPFRLTTKWFDVETGMHYYGHRYYAPRLGRWLNRDPSNEAGGTNLYVFVGNRTLNGVDPTGLAYWDTSVDRSVCCKFRSDREVKLTPFNTQSGTIITTRWMENRTARSVSDTPMETCSCCEKGQLRRDVSIVSAAWGKCCTCRMVVFKDTGQGASHTFFAIKCPDDSLWTAVDRFPDGDGSFLQEWVATPAATGVKEMEDDKINSAPDIYRDSQIDCDTGKKIKADMWRIGNLPVGATGYWKWDCRFWAKGLHDYWRDEGYPPSEGRACN